MLNEKVVLAEVNAVCVGFGIDYNNEPESVKKALRGCLTRGYLLSQQTTLSPNQTTTVKPSSNQNTGDGLMSRLKKLDNLFD